MTHFSINMVVLRNWCIYKRLNKDEWCMNGWVNMFCWSIAWWWWLKVVSMWERRMNERQLWWSMNLPSTPHPSHSFSLVSFSVGVCHCKWMSMAAKAGGYRFHFEFCLSVCEGPQSKMASFKPRVNERTRQEIAMKRKQRSCSNLLHEFDSIPELRRTRHINLNQISHISANQINSQLSTRKGFLRKCNITMIRL